MTGVSWKRMAVRPMSCHLEQRHLVHRAPFCPMPRIVCHLHSCRCTSARLSCWRLVKAIRVSERCFFAMAPMLMRLAR